MTLGKSLHFSGVSTYLLKLGNARKMPKVRAIPCTPNMNVTNLQTSGSCLAQKSPGSSFLTRTLPGWDLRPSGSVLASSGTLKATLLDCPPSLSCSFLSPGPHLSTSCQGGVKGTYWRLQGLPHLVSLGLRFTASHSPTLGFR